MSMPGIRGGLKRAPGSPSTRAEIAVSHMLVLGLNPGSVLTVPSVLIHQAIFLALVTLLYAQRTLGHHRDTCTSLIIAELFTTAKKWKQPRCAPIDKRGTHYNGIDNSHKESETMTLAESGQN